MQPKMLSLITASALALSFNAWAQNQPTPEFQVPVIREPHHFVKLENKYVRVLDVTVPAYSSTLYHIHENPYFWMSIGPATLKGNVLGSPETVDLVKKDGELNWSGAVTHRASNVGATAFRNITVQIQSTDDVSSSTAFLASPKPTGYQAEVPLDNALVHIERLILQPGQSTGRYSLPRSGMFIVVRDATVKLETPGTPAQSIALKAGDFRWHTGPVTHTITNVGSQPFEAIEAVWK